MPLSIQNISKSYSSTSVLNDLNFSIEENQIVGLLGKNGVGKTTLLKILSGISINYQGEVVLDNQYRPSDIEYKKSVGYLSEKNPLYPNMYVIEYLSWIAQSFDLSDISRRVKNVIEMTGLKDRQNYKIGNLSKGYKQRVGLAAAIVHDPKLLILDEPVNGLDPGQILDYRTLLKDLSKDKIIIISSHLMQEIEAVCNRVLLIEEGKITKDDFIGKSVDDEIQLWYIELGNDLPIEEFSAIDGMIDVQCMSANIYIFRSVKNQDPRKELFLHLAKNDNYILELRRHRVGLDQLFNN